MSVKIEISPALEKAARAHLNLGKSGPVWKLSTRLEHREPQSALPTSAELSVLGEPERRIVESKRRLITAGRAHRDVVYAEIGQCHQIAQFLDAQVDKTSYFEGAYAKAVSKSASNPAAGFRFILGRCFDEKKASKIFRGGRLFYAKRMSTEEFLFELRSQGGYGKWADKNSKGGNVAATGTNATKAAKKPVDGPETTQSKLESEAAKQQTSEQNTAFQAGRYKKIIVTPATAPKLFRLSTPSVQNVEARFDRTENGDLIVHVLSVRPATT